jgi:ParB-like chromosome segregation protein Spo0J
MKTSLIRTKHTFSSLFNINEKTLDDIIQNMKEYGYDPAFPLTLWEDVVIDGHTRLMAALTCDIFEVPVFQKEFANEKEALDYAIHNQRARRNLSEAELLRCIEAIDKPMSKEEAGAKGGTSNFESKNAKIIPSHIETAETLGIGQSKVSDARTVLKDETAKKEVESGKKTIAAAAKDVREKNKPKKEKVAKEVLSAELWLAKQKITNDITDWNFKLILDMMADYAVYYHKNIK